MPALLLAVALVTAACGSGNGIGGETVATTPSAGATDDEAAPVPAPGGDSTDAVVSSRGGDLLRTVQERGRLVCGVSGTRVIFSETQPDGSVVGVDADYCRAVAAAVLGDAGALEFVSLTTGERFVALLRRPVDPRIGLRNRRNSRNNGLN